MGEVRLLLGDCRDLLLGIPSGSVDVVLTDPPYPCIQRSYGTWTEEEWFAMMRVVVPECMRVLKPTGSAVFILQPNSERVGRMRTWLWEFMVWVGKEWGIVQDAYWWNIAVFPNGGAPSLGMLRSSVKPCIWIGSEGCYRNQDAVLWTETDRNKAMRQAERAERFTVAGKQVVDRRLGEAAVRRGGVTPFNLLPIPNADSQSSAGAFGHGAGTPLALCSWWLRYLCPDGGACLDPFSGVATVGVATKEQGLSYTGMERIEEYHLTAQKRLAAAQVACPLFAS